MIINTYRFKSQERYSWTQSNRFLEKEIECAIDEHVVDCAVMDSPAYTLVFLHLVLEDDDWFGPMDVSEKQQGLYGTRSKHSRNKKQKS